ncbi:MAG: MotA/TolQ/ExbB proton channel family protein [Gemmatimonadaceae bacterium]|nr:MotA/TolQ/ExbB proton channel family protein [Gemmatimonadaceae bacterium]MCW5825458.1 MotA/TolQ/ExbB proton channel family protein [Gemmatimonadaceae bacterium]
MILSLLQIRSAIPSTRFELVLNASDETKVVLVVLVVLSLLSWAVMLAKWLAFKKAEGSGRAFMAEFHKSGKLEAVASLAKRSKPSAYTRVLQRALQFLQETGLVRGEDGQPAQLSASQVQALRLVLDAETNSERERLGTWIPTLAMIGSVSPLLGLLGTVLGIIEAFLGVARGGSGNLAAIAPGVAEALIATATALAVAIPAYFGYNIFAARLNRFDGELDGFGTEVIALMAREGRL